MSDVNFNSIVISTRIRLARNFKKYPFVSRMSADQAKEIVSTVSESIINANESFKNDFEFYGTPELKIKGGTLLEKHLVSPELLKDNREHAAVISKSEDISVMINEEDHIRIQVIKSGYNLDEAYKTANLIDDLIEEKSEYAFTEKYGYTTSCPTNMGTGLRASVMLHLPAICLAGKMNELISTVNRLGIAVRGIYGEGTEAKGHLFQFSNQITLGMSEDEILRKLKNIIEQIARQEVDIRYKLKSDKLTDKICRSYGILKNSYLISYNEFMDLWSNVLLGHDMNIISVNRDELIGLISKCAPYNLLSDSKQNLDAEKRDKLRSEILRNTLK